MPDASKNTFNALSQALCDHGAYDSALPICEECFDELDYVGVVLALSLCVRCGEHFKGRRIAAVAQRWTEIVRVANALIHFHGAFGDFYAARKVVDALVSEGTADSVSLSASTRCVARCFDECLLLFDKWAAQCSVNRVSVAIAIKALSPSFCRRHAFVDETPIAQRASSTRRHSDVCSASSSP